MHRKSSAGWVTEPFTLKRKDTHSDSQRRWEAVRERAGKKPRHQLSSPRLAGPAGPGQCHVGRAEIAARQIEPPLHPAYSESLQGGALDSREKKGV